MVGCRGSWIAVQLDNQRSALRILAKPESVILELMASHFLTARAIVVDAIQHKLAAAPTRQSQYLDGLSLRDALVIWYNKPNFILTCRAVKLEFDRRRI